jgi:MazG family protein
MKSFDKLVKVMRKLRSPKGGCPWDRKQTHETLLKYLFEETEELKQSIQKKDIPNMEEELGDVLFQVLFHAQLASEKKHFNMETVIKTLTRKLMLRHPHVFGYQKEHRALLKGRKLSLKTEKEVLGNWDLLKTISRAK